MQRSLNIKEGGKWVKYVPEPTVTYVRFKDYGYEGKHILFSTASRERAFEVREGDDSSNYDHLNVYQGEEVIEEWAWDDGDKEWWRISHKTQGV